jgi:hypothetical protein
VFAHEKTPQKELPPMTILWADLTSSQLPGGLKLGTGVQIQLIAKDKKLILKEMEKWSKNI